MDHLISLFIDDEMDMDDKLSFVRYMKQKPRAANQTLHLLEQEKRIRGEIGVRTPDCNFTARTVWEAIRAFAFQPANLVAASLAVAVMVLLLVFPSPDVTQASNRFVIYRPDITRAEIVGSFTDWHKIPMQAVGDSGYWEIVMTIPAGEHRFSYILNGQNSWPDPTVLAREQDGFGGQNSIIHVGDRI